MIDNHLISPFVILFFCKLLAERLKFIGMKSAYTQFLLAFLFSLYSNAQVLELELFATNLDRPVNIKHSGDDKLYIVEQQGFISIVNSDGTVNSTPFLDIDSKVGAINSIGDERGLLGLAFHPNYSANGYFYVNYIDGDGDTVISRFTRDTTNPLIADSTSEFIILTYFQPFSNHNGGDMAFDANGYLYISSGDGGSGGDPQDNGQNINELLGKILRIDINSTTGTLNYSIPSDNPFVGNPSARGEIWAYGLRNPWKFSFDRMNGDIWIGDVGQGDDEEINKASSTASGLNYGWRCYEATTIYNNTGCPSSSSLTFPIAEYNHFSDGAFKCSITGGYRYRGTNFPGFDGWYFFADYCSEEIGYLAYDSTNDSWNMTLEQFNGNWSAFGEDVNGEIYVSDIQTGNIFKLIDTALSVDDNEQNTISIYPNPTKTELNINFGNIGSNTVPTKISIWDLHGKILKTINRTTNIVQKINTSELSRGIYLLKINTDNGEQSTHKLVIN